MGHQGKGAGGLRSFDMATTEGCAPASHYLQVLAELPRAVLRAQLLGSSPDTSFH